MSSRSVRRPAVRPVRPSPTLSQRAASPAGDPAGAATAPARAPAPQGTTRGPTAAPAPPAAPHGAAAPGPTADPGEEVDAATLWEAESVGPDAWRRVVRERRRERHRLDPPPKDCRGRPAYSTLRSLLLEDAEFRTGYLSVKWRGRPSGLPLLASLLQKGTLSPEVATDHEYLEAELGDLVQGDPQWRPSDGVWKAWDWTVVREGAHRDGLRYVATPHGLPG